MTLNLCRRRFSVSRSRDRWESSAATYYVVRQVTEPIATSNDTFGRIVLLHARHSGQYWPAESD